MSVFSETDGSSIGEMREDWGSYRGSSVGRRVTRSRDHSNSIKTSRPRVKKHGKEWARGKRRREKRRRKRTHQKHYPKTQPHPSNPYVHTAVSRGKRKRADKPVNHPYS